jgi:hypothetical protein
VVFFWQEVYFEQAEFLDRVFEQEVSARCSGVDFIADNDGIASGAVSEK